jgi:hypothetical protein
MAGVVSPTGKPQVGDHPLSAGCTAYSIYSQLITKSGGHLHPHPEDIPCRGDKRAT